MIKNFLKYFLFLFNIFCYSSIVSIESPQASFPALLEDPFVHTEDRLFSKRLLNIYRNKIYLQARLAETDKRYATFLDALDLLSLRKAKMLIETGTTREAEIINFTGDGASTIIFGDWAKQNKATLYSVDISPEAVLAAKTVTAEFGKNVKVFCSDSITFLETFDRPIDFLYLDSYDYNQFDPAPSQEHHLKEIIAAYPKLHRKSIVMIDDCDLPGGGKGRLVIDYLQSLHWKVFRSDYQVIMLP